MVPTFKETSYPIEEIFQVHTDDVIDSDFSFMDSEPLDIYSRQEIFDHKPQNCLAPKHLILMLHPLLLCRMLQTGID